MECFISTPKDVIGNSRRPGKLGEAVVYGKNRQQMKPSTRLKMMLELEVTRLDYVCYIG
ncbi:hypothetical protein KFK09_016664 [Dendrobium nobile]|uniref:Uncharacterized protein n=1 Tax=Dendrobium nobile TaxID=94219 RepID=A0A8T3AZA4_DENNO|nr:hypothetical protein KFK09_016664 [Dendrobium nobile]